MKRKFFKGQKELIYRLVFAGLCLIEAILIIFLFIAPIGSGTSASFVSISKKIIAPPEISKEKMLFGGDIMLGRYVESLTEANGEDYPFEKVSSLLLNDYDVVCANLEGPIVQGSPQTENESLIFSFPESSALTLARNGITHVSLANNHTLNYGKNGFEQTKQFLFDSHITTFGHPSSYTMDDVATTIINTTTYYFAGFDATSKGFSIKKAADLVKNLSSVNNAFIIINIHWGNEYAQEPNAVQKEYAKKLVDAGADLIIGHHPHVVQTMDMYNDVPIFYSLGNFIFDQYFSESTQKGLLLEVERKADTLTITLHPFSSSKSQPKILVGDEKNSYLSKWSEKIPEPLRAGAQKGFFTFSRLPDPS